MSTTHLIAVVDDDRSVRRALGRLLSSARYDVRLYASGADLLTSGDSAAVNCFVLDIHLDDMSGFGVCDRLRETGNLTPVIFMTARDSDETRARAASYASGAYLRKPFEAVALLDLIHAAIGDNPLPGGQSPGAAGTPS
jgi:DNA-binding response OmpR family regulator